MAGYSLHRLALAAGLILAGCDKAPAPSQVSVDAVAADEPAAFSAAMMPTKIIAENVAASPAHKQFLAALRQADLLQMLSGPGPYTVFAPTDDAFAQIPAVTREGWMRPEGHLLSELLRYHVVPAKLTAADIEARIAAGKGTAILKTIEGRDLTASMNGDKILLTSASGNRAIVTQADLVQANGVVQIVDAVLLPDM